ncbi:unnamed protein product, partial [Mesorhabditis spiculigera]
MSEPPKAKMTDAERAALAQKLDDDLDRFMEDLAAKKRAEGDGERKPFDFDEWCKDIDSHPAFMKELKGDGGEYSETIQALQAMKYDGEGEEDQIEGAQHDKDEGNKHFKLKKYRWATECYTRGLKRMCADRKLNSLLYQNRGAAQRHIGNLRSAVRDCVFSRRFDPTNLKAVVRGADCLLDLGYGQQCLDWIESSRKNKLEGDQKNFDALDEAEKKAKERAVVEERNARKERSQRNKDLAEKKKMLDALKSRAIRFKPPIDLASPELFEWNYLEAQLPQLREHQRVAFNEEGKLTWPLLLQYPETGQIDVLTECAEDVVIGELMARVLEEPAEWDTEHAYKMADVSFFVSDEYDEYVMEVYPWMEFGKILTIPGVSIKRGLPVMMVYTNRKVEKSFKREGEENKWVRTSCRPDAPPTARSGKLTGSFATSTRAGRSTPRIQYYVQRTFDRPASWFREKIVEPNNDGGRLPYYHRKLTRVPEIDECGVNDKGCFFEANEQYRLDKLVDGYILQTLRNRVDRCMVYNNPDFKKCAPEMEENELNFFVKYGELGSEADVRDVYMKQKHRLVWERRHPEIMDARKQALEDHKARLASGEFDYSFWKKGMFYQDKKNYEFPYEFYMQKSAVEGDKPLSKDWDYYKKVAQDPEFDKQQGKTSNVHII